MAANKTQATDLSVEAYLAAIDNDPQRQDCHTLMRLMARVTAQPATMWGTAIVGFGSYHYTYASGREGDACATGFSARKNGLSVYLSASAPDQAALLAKLGKHKMGQACLTLKSLADIDLGVLEQLIAGSVAEVKRRYP
jgi:Domain of unknown function (DU1801)